MSKRVTLTNTEIKWILKAVNRQLELDSKYTFQTAGLTNLRNRLLSEPVIKPKGLLKVHHNE